MWICISISGSLISLLKISVDPIVMSWPGFNSEARPEDQTQTEMMLWKQEEIKSHSADLQPNTSVLQKTREHSEISRGPGCIWGNEPKNRKASHLTTACMGEALYLQNLNLSHGPWCWNMPKQEKTASMEVFCLLSSKFSEAWTMAEHHNICLYLDSCSAHRVTVWNSPRCRSSVPARTGHCKSPEATAEEVEQIQTLAGCAASWMATHVDFLVRKKAHIVSPVLCGATDHCATTSAISPFLYLVACYQLYTMPMSWIGEELAGPGFLYHWNRPLYYIISALIGFITLVSKKAMESHDAVLNAAVESGTLCTNQWHLL